MHHVAANMREEDEIKACVAEHGERFGRIDVLMNNAGVGIGGAIDGVETKKLDMQLDVNLRAVYLVHQRGDPDAEGGRRRRRRADRQHGLDRGQAPAGLPRRLLGDQGRRDRAHGGDSDMELAADGVRGTAICPAFVDTPMTEWIRNEVPPPR